MCQIAKKKLINNNHQVATDDLKLQDQSKQQDYTLINDHLSFVIIRNFFLIAHYIKLK